MGHIIIKKSALTTCFSVGLNSIKPVYTWNFHILLNILLHVKCVMLSEVSREIGDECSIT